MGGGQPFLAIRKKPIVVACGLVIGAILGHFVFIGQPVFGSNDDPGMAMTAAGVFGDPSPDILFMHYFYGYVLVFLYRYLPFLPWHSLFLILFLAVSMIAINVAILRLWHPPLSAPLLLGATIGTIMPSLWHLQFTVVAGITTLSGGLLLLSATLSPPSNRREWLQLTLSAGSLMIVGWMLRYHSFLLSWILLAPPLVLFLLHRIAYLPNRSYTEKIKLWFYVKGGNWVGVSGVCILSIILLLTVLNHNRYKKDKEWEYWKKMNFIVVNFVDYGKIPYNANTKPHFDAENLTMNDWRMIMTWQWIDPVRFSVEKLERICRAVIAQKNHNQTHKFFGETARVAYQSIGSTIEGFAKSSKSILLGIVGSSLILLLSGRRWPILLLLIILASTLAVLVYIHVGLNRPMFRVILVVFLCTLWILLFVIAVVYDEIKEGMIRWLLSHMLFVLLIFSFIPLIVKDGFHGREYTRNAVAVNGMVKEVVRKWDRYLPKDAVIYNIGNSILLDYHLPFQTFEHLAKIKNFIGAGAGNQSPLQRRQITKIFGSEDVDFFLALSKHPYAYVTGGAYGFEPLVVYYEEHYGLELRLEETPNLPYLYRMIFRPLHQRR